MQSPGIRINIQKGNMVSEHNASHMQPCDHLYNQSVKTRVQLGVHVFGVCARTLIYNYIFTQLSLTTVTISLVWIPAMAKSYITSNKGKGRGSVALKYPWNSTTCIFSRWAWMVSFYNSLRIVTYLIWNTFLVRHRNFACKDSKPTLKETHELWPIISSQTLYFSISEDSQQSYLCLKVGLADVAKSCNLKPKTCFLAGEIHLPAHFALKRWHNRQPRCLDGKCKTPQAVPTVRLH